MTEESKQTKLSQEERLKLQKESLQRIMNFSKTTLSKEMASFTRVSSVLSNFTVEQITRFLNNPEAHSRELRELSNYLYSSNGTYKGIIQFFANMPKFAYTVVPYQTPSNINPEKYKESYFKTLLEIDKMNLKYEFHKVLKVAFKEDIYFGYVIENKDSTFFMPLDGDLCKISSIEDGIYNFAFDFSYFDRNKDELAKFPKEFKQKYRLYKMDTSNPYIELDSENTICIKVNDEVTYPLIPFSSVFESILDWDDYRKLKKQKTKMDNFLLLAMKIPQGDKNQVDHFTIDLNTAHDFYELLIDSLPEGVSAALTPMELEAIKMEKSRNDTDTIAQAQRDIYSSANVPQQVFNSDKNSAAGINKAITVAEQVVFGLQRQLQTWVNRRIRRSNSAYKFKLKFLDITAFSEKEQREALQKSVANTSLPLVSEYAASLGVTPLELYNKAILENEILGIPDLLKPLPSTYTQSGNENPDDVGGREALDDGEISSESTEQWRETDDANEE